MQDELLKKLKLLKSIEPDRDWSRASLNVILSQKQARRHATEWHSLFFRLSMITAVFVLVVLAAQKTNVPMKLAGLDASQLKAEAEGLQIKLELAEVTSSSVESKNINTALTQTAESEPGHLNTLVLTKESEGIQFENYENSDIDEALRQLAD
ncbi:MAG: hypothetical protein HYT12_01050 [Candidatus Liptonbacteria bacterium]|nr:hypothetical protein [Candidatus Liptonbacteria bacterium]